MKTKIILTRDKNNINGPLITSTLALLCRTRYHILQVQARVPNINVFTYK